MRRRLYFMAAAVVAALMTLLSPQAFAAFAEDTGALCADSEYFVDRGFDSATSMLESTHDLNAESFVLVFYSRYDSTSQNMLPQIQQWADENKLLVYGIDQYNRYTWEFGYFNTQTTFVGWEKYLDPVGFSFPAAFVYNSDTRMLSTKSGLNKFSLFYELLDSAGMLKEPYHDYEQAGISSARLDALGLMQGTGDGLDLLRAPTRAEALTMLIRLLGHDEEALLCRLSHPFEDVPAWASPYVGYAYYHGITQGVSETKFDPNSPITAAEYLTLTLRALGYQSGEGGDFAWDDPFALAIQTGIMPVGVNTREFIRADMAVVSYAALSANLKGSTSTLAHRLVAQRAVDAQVMSQYVDYTVSAPSAREDLAQTAWQAGIFIDKRSPKYTVEAINAAVYSAPTAIVIHATDGTIIDWTVYLMDKISFPKELVSSYRLQLSGEYLFVIPEYTVAAKAYAALTVPGYRSEGSVSITAQFVKSCMGQILMKGTEDFLDEYFDTAEIIAPDDPTASVYGDADAALLLRHSTEEAIERARWLIEEYAVYYRKFN